MTAKRSAQPRPVQPESIAVGDESGPPQGRGCHTSNQQIGADYVAAFAQGSPTSKVQAQLRTSVLTILGPSATSTRTRSVDRLVADAPAFDRAVASSEAYIQTIVSDVAAVVDSGGGESLNPFRVTIPVAGHGRRGG
jgi:hypothetical protein